MDPRSPTPVHSIIMQHEKNGSCYEMWRYRNRASNNSNASDVRRTLRTRALVVDDPEMAEGERPRDCWSRSCLRASGWRLRGMSEGEEAMRSSSSMSSEARLAERCIARGCVGEGGVCVEVRCWGGEAVLEYVTAAVLVDDCVLGDPDLTAEDADVDGCWGTGVNGADGTSASSLRAS